MSATRLLADQKRTDLVSFSIKINSSTSPVGYVDAPVFAMTIHKEVNKVPFARVLLRDGEAASGEFSLSNKDLYVPGNEIEILNGYHHEEKTIFKGIIVQHNIKIRENKPAMLELICKDKAVKLTIGRKNKVFHDLSDAEAIEEILSTYGLANDVAPTDTVHQEIIQYYTTDWDFVLSRSDANGRVVIIHDGQIEIKTPDLSQSPSIELEYGSTIKEFEGEIDARYQYSSVKASSWSYANQDLLEEEGEAISFGEDQGNLSADDLAGVIGLESLELRHSGKVIDQELRDWASAQLLRSTLAKIRGRVKVPGTNEVKVGDIISLGGIGDRFNGPAYVSAIHHSIAGEKSGLWTTQLQLGLSPDFFSEHNQRISNLPASGLMPAVSGLQIGVVSQLQDDPDGEDRIQVKCPIIDPTDPGVWARLASLDAGNERGWVHRPEIGDEVIVGFVNDDPRSAVVLGQLHSSANPAPITGSDENHIKGYTSRSNMKFLFDDENNVITIETPAGNSMVISESDSSIEIKDQNDNKITMDGSGISIESARDITMEAQGKISMSAQMDVSVEGLNIKNTAQAQLKLEGSATSEITSSGITKVQGSLVKIN